MAIDVSGPQVPGWWFQRLARQLVLRAPGYDLLDRYYTGESVVPLNTVKATREAYLRLMALARTNYAELVVEAPRERMQPLGFRTGGSNDELGDEEAWRIWQANSLDADSGIAHRAGLAMGRMYVMVGGVDPDLEAPLITIEDPREVITEQHPTKRRQSVAALKVFRDEWYGAERAYLYVGGRIYRYSRSLPTVADGVESKSLSIADMNDGGWEEDSWDPLAYGMIPVVEFTNRTKTNGEPYGEFETHLPLLDRINYDVLNRLEIMTLQAFKQRAIKGVPQKDERGNDIDYSDIFNADPGAMWQLPETAEIWESEQVDIGPLRMASRDDVQDLAAVTRTPLFYLTPDAANGSAEGASLAREGLVFKTRDRLGQYGESWEQVMSMAFTVMGDAERARRVDMEIIWRNPEHFSMAERFDAASKANAAGVPWSKVMSSILDYTPQEIDRMEKERAAEKAAEPPPPPPVVAPIGELTTATNP